ncbi:MAG: hypothetical protein ABL958_19300, partial [Bdellovibrionia bacterium]
YDLAITALPARDRARLKLLHVSRLSIPEDSKTYDRGKHIGQPDSKTARENLKGYLVQEGITEEFLAKNKVLLFDSGFKGTIPDAIDQLYPEHLRQNIVRHYLLSGDAKATSTWSFIEKLSPGSLVSRRRTDRHAMSSEVDSLFKIFEGLPKYEPRTAGYARDPRTGRFSVVKASMYDNDEARVTPEKAQEFMEDVKAYGEREDVRAELANQRNLWRAFVRLSRTASKSVFLTTLKRWIAEGRIASDLQIDFIDYFEMRRPSPYRISENNFTEADPHFKIKGLMENDFAEFERFLAEHRDRRSIEAVLDILPELTPELTRAVLRSLAADVHNAKIVFSYYYSKPHSLEYFDLIPTIVDQHRKFSVLTPILWQSVFTKKFSHARIEILFDTLKQLQSIDREISVLILSVLRNVENDRLYARLADFIAEHVLHSESFGSSLDRKTLLKALIQKGAPYESRAEVLMRKIATDLRSPSDIANLVEIMALNPKHPVVVRYAAAVYEKVAALDMYTNRPLLAKMRAAGLEGAGMCHRLF